MIPDEPISIDLDAMVTNRLLLFFERNELSDTFYQVMLTEEQVMQVKAFVRDMLPQCSRCENCFLISTDTRVKIKLENPREDYSQSEIDSA